MEFLRVGILVFAVLCPLYYYHQRHPVNYFLLGIFTITLAFAIGLTCAYTSGKIDVLISCSFLLIQVYLRTLQIVRQNAKLAIERGIRRM